jgi:hypothetical protein
MEVQEHNAKVREAARKAPRYVSVTVSHGKHTRTLSVEADTPQSDIVDQAARIMNARAKRGWTLETRDANWPLMEFQIKEGWPYALAENPHKSDGQVAITKDGQDL